MSLVCKILDDPDAGTVVRVYPDHDHAVVDFGALYEMKVSNEREAELLRHAWEELDDGTVHYLR